MPSGTEVLECLHAFVHKVNIVRRIEGMIEAFPVPDVEKENESCSERPETEYWTHVSADAMGIDDTGARAGGVGAHMQ